MEGKGKRRKNSGMKIIREIVKFHRIAPAVNNVYVLLYGYLCLLIFIYLQNQPIKESQKISF